MTAGRGIVDQICVRGSVPDDGAPKIDPSSPLLLAKVSDSLFHLGAALAEK